MVQVRSTHLLRSPKLFPKQPLNNTTKQIKPHSLPKILILARISCPNFPCRSLYPPASSVTLLAALLAVLPPLIADDPSPSPHTVKAITVLRHQYLTSSTTFTNSQSQTLEIESKRARYSWVCYSPCIQP